MQLQPTLLHPLVTLRPLAVTDFESLFAIAKDELLWEQHPAKERSQRDGFANFFDKALQSAGALVIIDNTTQEIIGTSRYYEWQPFSLSVAIGYTFISRNYWGTPYNRLVKTLMLDHAFLFVQEVFFYVDSENIRSQKAIIKLGAVLHGAKEVFYSPDLLPRKSLIFCLPKQQWEQQSVPKHT